MRVICIKADGTYYPGVARLEIGTVYEVDDELPGEYLFLGCPGVIYYHIPSLNAFYVSYCFSPWSDADEANVNEIFNLSESVVYH